MTDRQTDTHTQTYGHQCLSSRVQGLQGLYKIFIFLKNSMLRYSNASRSNLSKITCRLIQGNPQSNLYNLERLCKGQKR
jgi:hypothetical protein